jgi:hypothetical protein
VEQAQVRENPAHHGWGLHGGDAPQPAATARAGEGIEIDTRRIKAARVNAPGVAAAWGLASR